MEPTDREGEEVKNQEQEPTLIQEEMNMKSKPLSRL